MNRANLAPACSAAIPTGAGRSGFRSIFSRSSRSGICNQLRRRLDGRTADRIGQKGEPRAGGRRARAPLARDCSCSTQTAGARRSEQIPASSATRRGAICCSSTNISTARPARVLAPRIRPAGRRWPGRWWRTGVCEMIGTPADGAIFQFDNPRRPRVSTHKLPGAVRNVVNASTLFSARSSRNPLRSARSFPSHCQLGTSLFLADVASV